MPSTISYSLLPEPIWYFVDLSGLPLGSGQMFTYSSLNPTVPKPVFMDAQGANAWPNPVNIGLNGTSGPFYFKFDSANPSDLYDIVVRDVDGNLIWQVNNFQGGSGGGGGGGTTYQQLNNLVINNVFWRNIGTVTPAPLFQKLAPSAHEGLAPGANTGGWTGEDIVFSKNSLANTDTLSFPAFAAGALSPDVTPTNYFNYTCGTSSVGESYKYVQIPITNEPNLSQQQVTVTLWARCNSGASAITLNWRSFFGDSGGTPDILTPISSLTLTSAWTKYTAVVTTPNAAAGTPGACGNGALFLQINLPLNAVTNIDLSKPSVYLGLFAPTTTFDTMDQITAIFDTPRTGDTRTSLNNFSPYGWVPMNDGTIGSATSGGTTRASIDTYPLYKIIWDNVNGTFAPTYTSTGVPVARGASAVADFAANNRLALTKALGRVFAGTAPQVSLNFTVNTAVTGSNLVLTSGTTASTPLASPVILTSTGTMPSPLISGVIYYAIPTSSTQLAVALTAFDATQGVGITLTTNGTGTLTLRAPVAILGEITGEVNNTGQSGGYDTVYNASPLTAPAAGSSTHNSMQPTTFMNVFIKL